MLEMRIHGRGGQGVVTLAELLAKVAMEAGREVQTCLLGWKEEALP